MKKLLGITVLFMLLAVGCGSLTAGQAVVNIPAAGAPVFETSAAVESEHSDIKIPEAAKEYDPLCKDGDVEENINDGSLSEDNKNPEINGGADAAGNGGQADTGTPEGPANTGDEASGTIVKSFNTVIPSSLPVSLKYDKYKVDNDYLIVMSPGANIREKPDSASPKIKTAQYLERFRLEAEVKGEYLAKYDSDKWYEVSWQNGRTTVTGYIYSALAEPRLFQFEKMLNAVNNLKKETDSYTSGYIANYKDRNGQAPAYNGGNGDPYGTERYQSAPAYTEASFSSGFRYIQDGTLVSILAETDSFYKVRTLSFEGEYYVPKKYVSFGQAVKSLKKVVVVDRKNQNEGVFELIDGKWNLISYIYATTGETAKYKQATSLGYYTAIQKADKFKYLDDVTKKIAGYAPYAVRFNGGAYIHGVPIDYEVNGEQLIDPGMQEFLYTIGTIPRSHKCVRNYTSHALFLYNWVDIGSSAVIVIE